MIASSFRLRAFLVLARLLCLTGCNESETEADSQPIISGGRPTDADMNAIERAIVRHDDPCVGDLRRWVREYYFRYWNGGVDRRYIVIRMGMPEDTGLAAGRHSEFSAAVIRIDDRDIISAFGILDRQRGLINYWRCGNNLVKPGERDSDRAEWQSIPIR